MFWSTAREARVNQRTADELENRSIAHLAAHIALCRTVDDAQRTAAARARLEQTLDSLSSRGEAALVGNHRGGQV